MLVALASLNLIPGCDDLHVLSNSWDSFQAQIYEIESSLRATGCGVCGKKLSWISNLQASGGRVLWWSGGRKKAANKDDVMGSYLQDGIERRCQKAQRQFWSLSSLFKMKLLFEAD